MDALEKRAFMKVSGPHAWLSRCLFSPWIYRVRPHSRCWTYITCFRLFQPLWFCLLVAIPNPKRSGPGGTRRPVVSQLHMKASVGILVQARRWSCSWTTPPLCVSCLQPGVCNSSVLRPLPTKKVRNSFRLYVKHDVEQTNQESCSTISLQLHESERAGSRPAGEDQANQPQHHHRLFQQGPVGGADASPPTYGRRTFVFGKTTFYPPLLFFLWVLICFVLFLLVFKCMKLLRLDD